MSSRGIFRSLVEKHSTFLGLLREHAVTSTSTSGVTLRKDGEGFAELVLENPSQRNAMTASMMLDLAEHVDHLTLEDDQLVGLCIRSKIGPEGKPIFCSGLDLNLAQRVINSGERGQMMYLFMTDALDRIRKAPFISATVVGGAAIGGGLELTTATDYRVVVQKPDGAPFFQSVHAKIGATPGWGGLQRSMEILGRKHSLSIFGTSARVSAEDALDLGFVDRIETWNKANEDLDFDSFCSLQGRQFLAPFLCQSYPQSIRGMKTIIAAAGKSDLCCEVAKVEEKVFYSRWMGEDMKDALSNQAKSK